MVHRKTKWLMYTVLVGLIPALCRFTVWLVSENRTSHALNPVDIVVFGLILHCSNINEIEHMNDDGQWKTIQNGTSIAFIAVYAFLLATYLLGQSNPGLIDTDVARYVAVVLGLVSLLLSFSIHNRISKLGQAA